MKCLSVKHKAYAGTRQPQVSFAYARHTHGICWVFAWYLPAQAYAPQMPSIYLAFAKRKQGMRKVVSLPSLGSKGLSSRIVRRQPTQPRYLRPVR